MPSTDATQVFCTTRRPESTLGCAVGLRAVGAAEALAGELAAEGGVWKVNSGTGPGRRVGLRRLAVGRRRELPEVFDAVGVALAGRLAEDVVRARRELPSALLLVRRPRRLRHRECDAARHRRVLAIVVLDRDPRVRGANLHRRRELVGSAAHGDRARRRRRAALALERRERLLQRRERRRLRAAPLGVVAVRRDEAAVGPSAGGAARRHPPSIFAGVVMLQYCSCSDSKSERKSPRSGSFALPTSYANARIAQSNSEARRPACRLDHAVERGGGRVRVGRVERAAPRGRGQETYMVVANCVRFRLARRCRVDGGLGGRRRSMSSDDASCHGVEQRRAGPLGRRRHDIGRAKRPPHLSPRLGAISNSTKFAWRLVVTPRFVGNRCFTLACAVPRAPDAFQKRHATICSTRLVQADVVRCKALWWFYRAVDLYRDAAFIGKVEDDTVVQPELLERELRWALARRPAGARRTWLAGTASSRSRCTAGTRGSPHGGRGSRRRSSAAGARGREAWHKEYVRCHESWPNATVAPFASGGIGVRSWALAHFSSHACRLPWNDEYQAACDGDQGYDIARCLAGLDPATARRFRRRPPRAPPSTSST